MKFLRIFFKKTVEIYFIMRYTIKGSFYSRAEIAQLVEHFTRNEGVVGSSPIFGFNSVDAVNLINTKVYGIFYFFNEVVSLDFSTFFLHFFYTFLHYFSNLQTSVILNSQYFS